MVSSVGNRKQYSTVRYWRYIFTPLLLVTALFGLFLLFTAPDAQTASYNTLVQRTNVSLGSPVSAMSTNIVRGLQGLKLDPSAP